MGRRHTGPPNIWEASENSGFQIFRVVVPNPNKKTSPRIQNISSLDKRDSKYFESWSLRRRCLKTSSGTPNISEANQRDSKYFESWSPTEDDA